MTDATREAAVRQEREALWDRALMWGSQRPARERALQALIDFEVKQAREDEQRQMGRVAGEIVIPAIVEAERDAHAEVVRAAREVDAIVHEEVLDLPLEHAVKRWRNRMEQAHERLRVALAPFMTTEEAPLNEIPVIGAKEVPDLGKTLAEAESLFMFATARLIREGADRYGERWNKYKDEWEAAIRAEHAATWRTRV